MKWKGVEGVEGSAENMGKGCVWISLRRIALALNFSLLIK